MKLKTQRYLSWGLALLNVAGVVGTFYTVSKEAPTAQVKLKTLPKDAKKITKVKTFIKNYKMSLIFAGATIASGIGSKVLSAKTEASLLATIGVLDASLHKYKYKVKKALGTYVDEDIRNDIIKELHSNKSDLEPEPGEELFKHELIGYFYCKPENLYKAMNMINNDLSGEINYYETGMDNPKEYTFGELLRIAKARPLSHTLDQTKLNFGWSYEYLTKKWDTVKVHWDCGEPDAPLDDDGARLLTFYEDPIWAPDSWDLHSIGKISDKDYFEGSDAGLVIPTDPVYEVEEPTDSLLDSVTIDEDDAEFCKDLENALKEHPEFKEMYKTKK